jgi:predicted phage-related endonuclease
VNFTIIDAPQRSPEWLKARAGRLTGTRAAAILAKGKGAAESVQRRDLRMLMACEILTGEPQEDTFVNGAMQRGIDKEAAALAAIEVRTGEMIETTGFLSHNTLQAGCSLDGHIDGFRVIVECKCPKTSTHLGYWRSGGIPSDYFAQLTHNAWIAGAQEVWFASFDDRLPPPLQLYLVRAPIAQFDVAGYEAEAAKFLSEVDAEIAQIKALAAAA